MGKEKLYILNILYIIYAVYAVYRCIFIYNFFLFFSYFDFFCPPSFFWKKKNKIKGEYSFEKEQWVLFLFVVSSYTIFLVKFRFFFIRLKGWEKIFFLSNLYTSINALEALQSLIMYQTEQFLYSFLTKKSSKFYFN